MKSILIHAKSAFALGAMAALGIAAMCGPAFAQIPPTDVPEPSSMALMAAGVGAIALYRKLRKRK